MKLFIWALLFLSTTTLFSQTIKTIQFEGMMQLSKPVALRMLPFEVGDTLDEKSVNTAIKKFFNQGYFDDIWVEVNEGDLTFHFKEKAIISKVELKGWKESDEDVKLNVIQVKKGSLYNEQKLEAAKKRIIDAISTEGKIDSVVEIKTEHLENGSVKVTFVVNEGEEIIIDTLEYSGVKGVDSSDFNDVIANKEHQFMGWFWGRNDGKMSLKDLEYDNLRIRDYYMQYGYLDAKVNEPFVRVNFDHYTANMSYQIEEGVSYSISKITFFQESEVIAEEKIREIIALKEGETFNIKTFREDSEKIKTLIADLSYAYVQVVPDLRKNKDDNTVEVVFKITPGERVKVRNVLISGNTRTLDRLIRRELYLGPGDMYSLTDLSDSRNALGRLGFFEGNTIEEKRVDNQTMDLVVKVKEAPTGNIQLGGGYGSFGGILLSIAVNDRNVFGSGINVGVKLERSQRTENYSFNISNPRLNDSDFSGNFSIFHSATNLFDYSIATQGVSLGVGHRFSRHVSGYLGYGYSSNAYDLSRLDENSTFNVGFRDPRFFQDFTKSSVTVSINWDNTDDFYLPRSGFTLSQSFEKAGLGAEADFLKSRTSFNKYKGLEEWIGFDTIFRYKSRFNAIVDNGNIPIAEKFYMGGIRSVRGYQAFSLSPYELDPNAPNGRRRLGGNMTFSNSAELSFPLVPKAKMRLVSFVDWGFIGDDSLSEISRGGYGLGLEWFSPVGPIQLMFARPLNEQEGDRTAAFEFTMGQRF